MLQPGTAVYYQGRRAWVLDSSTEDLAAIRVIDPPFSSNYRDMETLQVAWDAVERKFDRPDKASMDAFNNANDNRHKKPTIRTLSEEYAEAILAERGKHEHPLRLELVQIAGICINMIRQIDSESGS